MMESCARALRTSCGIDVEVAGPAMPSNCSAAAAVLLVPSTIEAIDWGGPRINTPFDTVGSPYAVGSLGPLGPVSPSPVQKT